MSDQRYPNPYVDQAPPPGPLAPTAATDVRPDARTQQAFLTHAFVWMFVGLAVTAGVAYFVQSNERLLEFTSNNVFLLLIAQFALAMGISSASGASVRRPPSGCSSSTPLRSG